ncbi:MAG: PAS domain-containing protein, partial [Bacteroidota bacterium]
MAVPPRLFRSRLVEFVDVFLPDPPISETQRRRMRAVVVGALVTIPFGLIATQQIYEYIGLRDSLYALAGLLMLLACPMLLRTTRSATLPGLVQAFSLLGLLFMMAMLDGGLDDPSLYWVPLIPMAAAVTIGPLGIATTLVASIAGVLVLYMLTLEGYAFPDYSSGLVRSWFDMFALCTGACFAALVGGLYERHTRHELSRLSEGVRGLQGELGRSEERYQALFEHLPIGMYRTTPSGEVVLANDAFLRMLGYRSLREFQRERERVSATYADPAIRDDLVQRLRQFGQVSQYEL